MSNHQKTYKNKFGIQNTDDLIAILNEKNPFVELVGEWCGMTPPTKFKHKECGMEFLARVTDVIDGVKCPHCFKTKRKTTEEFKNEVLKIAPEFEVLGEYKTCLKDLKFKHKICGNEFITTPNRFLCGSRCPICSKNSNLEKIIKLKEDRFEDHIKKRLKETFGNDYTLLSCGNKRVQPIFVRHNICGKEYQTTVLNLISHKCQCAFCFGTKNHTLDWYQKKFDERTLEKFTVIEKETNIESEFCRRTDYIRIRHEKCQKEFSNKISNFMNSPSCPFCRSNSKGRDTIVSYLENANYSLCAKENILKKNLGLFYALEFTFDDCKDKRELPFDILIKKDSEILLVEFDGRQHIEKSSKFFSEDLVKHDKIKNNYCSTKNIPFIRISKIKEIENILKSNQII